MGTISLRPVKHRRYTWRVSYSAMLEGAPVYRQRYFKSRTAAEDFKRELTPALAAAGTELGEISPEERRALSLWRERTRELRDKIEVPPLDAVLAAEAERLSASVASVTLAIAIQATLDKRIREGRKPRTIDDLRYRLRRLERDMGGDRIVATITTEAIDLWLRDLDQGPQSIVNFRRAAHTLFAECVRRGWRTLNPVAHAEKPRVPQREIGILAPGEALRVLTAAEGAVRAGVVLQLFCGLRESEVVSLAWAAVNIPGGHIRIETSKTGRRLVPIPANAAEWLSPVASTQGRVWNGTRFDYSAAVRAAFVKAGVPRVRNGLRHSAITYRLAATQNLAQTALEAGNSPHMVRLHYAELVAKEQGNAFFEIRPDHGENVVTMLP